jgi:hypothetical protein
MDIMFFIGSRRGREPSAALSGRPRSSAIMQGDQFGDAGRTLTAFDFDHHAEVDAQAVGRDLLHFGDAGTPPDPRAGRDGGEVG